MMLLKEGFSVAVAPHGAAAVAAVCGPAAVPGEGGGEGGEGADGGASDEAGAGPGGFDAMFMDGCMPVMDG